MIGSDVYPSSTQGTHEDADSRFHHLKSRIELVSAGRAPDAVRFARELVAAYPHAAAIGTACEMDPVIVDGFVLRSAETIHVLAVEQPGLARIIDNRQGEIMAFHIVFKFASARESVLDQLAAHSFMQCVFLRDGFRRAHVPPPGWIEANQTTPE